MPTRRRILAGLTGSLTASLLPLGLAGCSRAGSDGRPALEVLVPSGPGGGWDQTARSMERALTGEGLAASVRIEHAVGGGGAVGLARFLGDPGRADALMIGGLVMVGALATGASPVRLADTTPIARLTAEYQVIAVHRDSPITSIDDLVARLRSDPGSISWAGGAAGGTDHLLVAMVAEAAGVDPARTAYVAYAGGGLAQATLLGNQVSCGVSGYGELAEQIASGALRALAISAPQPLPDIAIPTLRQAGLDLELVNWRAAFGAPGLADGERDRLIDLLRRMTGTPTWHAELARHRWDDAFMAGAEFAQYLAAETARIEALLRRLGLAASAAS